MVVNLGSWKIKLEYDTAILAGAVGSGCQLMEVAVRRMFTFWSAFGSRKTARPLALGGSLE